MLVLRAKAKAEHVPAPGTPQAGRSPLRKALLLRADGFWTLELFGTVETQAASP